MRQLLALVFALQVLMGATAQACAVCRPRVQAAIHNPDYAANALLLLLPIGLLVAGALLLFFSPNLVLWKSTTSPPSAARP